MILSLTRRQMLDRWMLMKGFLPARTDASVTRADGIDLEALMESEMRAWYLRMLDTAPPHLTGITDIASRVTLTLDTQGPAARVELPADCRRVVRFRLDGWHNDAILAAPDSPEAQREDNRLTRGGMWHPVAVMWPGGILTTRALPPGPKRIAVLTAITDPGPDLYRFDESLFPKPEYPNLTLT